MKVSAYSSDGLVHEQWSEWEPSEQPGWEQLMIVPRAVPGEHLICDVFIDDDHQEIDPVWHAPGDVFVFIRAASNPAVFAAAVGRARS